MFRWFRSLFGTSCLKRDEFDRGLEKITEKVHRLERLVMAKSQEVKDALAANTDAVQKMHARLTNVVVVMGQLRDEITRLKESGGATTSELDEMLTTITGNTEMTVAGEAALDAADGEDAPPAG
jgi:hypothetical protein